MGPLQGRDALRRRRRDGRRLELLDPPDDALDGPELGLLGQIHTGQEVVIFHIDGDPDRPVMAGAVPNFENPAIVTSQNPNVSQTVSRGQSGFRIRDE
jgi:uncharacterized protein involved in type VI secretion and phage assembly